MSQKDWYRQKKWTSRIAEDFDRRLAKTRSRRCEYLRVQALTLVDTNEPENALPAVELARRQLQSDKAGIHSAQMYATIARAYTTIGNLDAALDAHRRAVEFECKRPNIRGYHYIEFAWFVATNGLSDIYNEVLSVMKRNMDDGDLMFPHNQYHYFGALAMISYDSGDLEHAMRMARNAIQAVLKEKGPFNKYPGLGLFKGKKDKNRKRLERLAG